MRRAIVAAVLGAATLGGVVLAPAADAASVCVEIHLNVNGTPVDIAECPALPGVPTLP